MYDLMRGANGCYYVLLANRGWEWIFITGRERAGAAFAAAIDL